MKASDLLVRALEHEGIKIIFGLPGEENLDLVESLRNSSIRLVVTRHEQGAGFMAATYGRLTGKAGVCIATLGPGATNLVTPAAYAQLGAMPMLMITGQKPIKSSKQAHFQIINVVEMMRPVTKFCQQVIHGNGIPAKVREAIRIAEQERPGAVHLELPEDVAREEAEPFLFPVEQIRRPAAESKAVRRAAEAIAGARRPLLLVGAGANRSMTSRMLSRFVENLQIPFFTTQMGKGVLDERHPLYLGTAALSENDVLHDAVNLSDLIINVGHDVVEKPPFFMHGSGGPEVIHVNYSPAEVDPVYFPRLQVIGDVANAIWQLGEQLAPQRHWETDCFLEVKRSIDERMAAQVGSPSFPIKPQRLVRDVRAAMPDDGIIALDNGMYKIWFARNYPAYRPNTVLLDNALATMGAGLPSAMAAALLHPKRKVVAVCGDGGFMMNSQELETAKRLGINLTVLILRDDGYGMIRWKQESMGFADFGLGFENPDFVKYAAAYGVDGRRIERTDDFLPTLKACLAAPGVHVLDVPIDYSENRIFNRELERSEG